MTVSVSHSQICGSVKAPASKSCAHRLLIAAFLRGGECTVCGIGGSEDIAATLECLTALGGEFSREGDNVCFSGRGSVGSVTADCNESGSTLRFLLPVASALGINATFTGRGRLMSRPLGGLIECLNKNGADIRGNTVYGKLSAGRYVIDGSLSSQYVSGLILALCALSGESELTVTGKPVSAAYIDITVNILRSFGAKISKSGNVYKITGGFDGDVKSICAEGDWSNAAFLLSAGAICGEITVSGLDPLSAQGDRQIVSVLREFGADVYQTDNGITVKRRALRGITVDIEQIPDLAQIISVLGAFAEGVTVLKNISRLILKESDRVNAICNMLSSANIRCEERNGELTVYGGAPAGGKFSGGDDHRTVMSSTVLALGASGSSTLSGAGAVRKSYPSFFTDISAVGGNIYVDI